MVEYFLQSPFSNPPFSSFSQDDELDEETKSYLLDSTQNEDDFLKSPTESNASKSPDEPASTEQAQQKKVILKRKLTTSISTDSETVPAATIEKVSKIDTEILSEAENGNTDTESGDKKVVKLSELSIKDRLELRAKKFGVPVPPEAAKLARADRFGTAASGASATKPATGSSGPIAVTASASVDVLKKRAERFGVSVSKVMNTLENKEKLQKRQERFGAAAATPTVSTVAIVTTAAATDDKTEAPATVAPAGPTVNYAEKARLRLERFKTAVK